MIAPNTRRIVLFGKTGAGKSSLANTIFGEELFLIKRSLDSETTKCQVKTKSINGKSITLIDNPGFFDPGRSENDLKADIQRCITECAPGPHVFLIVLKVERFTEHEKAIITQICDHFSEDALKYAAVVFTCGDQLPEGTKIQEFVNQNKDLSDLMKKCGGRCHVVDNKYWKNQEDEYRSNHFQVSELLKTTEKIVEDNNGDYYSNEMLQDVERKILKEEERIRPSSGNMPQEEIRKQARSNVLKNRIQNTTQTWTPYLVGGAVIALIAIASAVLIKSKFMKATKEDLTAAVIPLVTPPVIPPGIKEPEVVIPAPPANVIEEPQIQKPNTIKVIIDRLFALYERISNLWNPFE